MIPIEVQKFASGRCDCVVIKRSVGYPTKSVAVVRHNEADQFLSLFYSASFRKRRGSQM